MIDKAIMNQKVSNKLYSQCLSAIVTETMMRALPLTKEDIAAEHVKYFNYCSKVISALHGTKTMENAIESNMQNKMGLKLLKSIDSEIASIVDPAVNRIVTEASNDNNASLDDVVDKAEFTKEEMAKLIKSSKDIGIPEISNLIKDKVVATIKSEKAAYDDAEKLKADIADALQDELGDDAPSVEAYMDIVLAKNSPRDHISFFSKLQDICIESLLNTESTNELYNTEFVSLESLVSVTLNSTFDCFDKNELPLMESLSILSKAIEQNDCDEEEMQDRFTCATKKGFIMSIIITTIFETLKTLRLYSPDLADVKKFVDTPTNAKPYDANIADKITDKINDTKKMLRDPQLNRPELTYAMGAFNEIKEQLECISESILPSKKALISEIDSICESIESKIVEDYDGKEPILESFYENLSREHNVSEFDKAARVLFRNPDTSKIQVVCEAMGDEAKNNMIIIRGVSESGSITDTITSTIVLESTFKGLVNEIRTAAKYSNLSKYKNQSEMYFSDKCYAVPLIDE